MDLLSIILIIAAFVMCLVMSKARIDAFKQEAIYEETHEPVLSPEHNLSLPGETCTHCGEPMGAEEIFCPSCMKITPRIKEMLDIYPDRQPHEFLSFSVENRIDYRCPHCHSGNIYHPTEYVHTPIICCPDCHEYFLSTSIPEPYLNPQSPKYIDCLARIINRCLIILAVSFLFHLPKWLWFLLTVVYTPLRFYASSKENPQNLQYSKQRVDTNPEYVQILADMGYLPKIDSKFHNMIYGYGQDATRLVCEYCGSKNELQETFCAFCTAPLPKPYQRKYVQPIAHDIDNRDQVIELVLKVLLEICGIILYFAQWTFA